MKTKLMTLVLTLSCTVAFAQHDHAGHDQSKVQTTAATFKDAKLGTAYTLYLKVKDALVASNADDAKKAAGELQKALKEVKGFYGCRCCDSEVGQHGYFRGAA
jgi:hypothetical protein